MCVHRDQCACLLWTSTLYYVILKNNYTKLWLTCRWVYEYGPCGFLKLIQSKLMYVTSRYLKRMYVTSHQRSLSRPCMSNSIHETWLLRRLKEIQSVLWAKVKIRTKLEITRRVAALLGHLAMRESWDQSEFVWVFQLLAQHDLKMSLCNQPARQSMLFWF